MNWLHRPKMVACVIDSSALEGLMDGKTIVTIDLLPSCGPSLYNVHDYLISGIFHLWLIFIMPISLSQSFQLSIPVMLNVRKEEY